MIYVWTILIHETIWLFSLKKAVLFHFHLLNVWVMN